jgi:hypothetical protein
MMKHHISTLAVGFAFLVSLQTQSETLRRCNDFDSSVESIRKQSALHPQTGILVTLPDRQNTIYIWDTAAHKLLRSQELPPRHGAFHLLGFLDSDNVLIFDQSDWTDSVSKNKVFQFNIKTFEGKYLWQKPCGQGNSCGTLYPPYSPRFNFLNDVVNGYIPDVIDAQTGSQVSTISQKFANIWGDFSADGQHYYGILDWPLYAQWPQDDTVTVWRWTFPEMNPEELITFKRSEIPNSSGLDIAPPLNPILLGNSGSLVLINEVSAGLTLKFVDVRWYDKNNSTSVECQMNTENYYRYQILDETKKTILLAPLKVGTTELPSVLDMKTCKSAPLPHVDRYLNTGWDNKMHAQVLMTQETQGRILLRNSNYVWDARTGELLLKMCRD